MPVEKSDLTTAGRTAQKIRSLICDFKEGTDGQCNLQVFTKILRLKVKITE